MSRIACGIRRDACALLLLGAIVPPPAHAAVQATDDAGATVTLAEPARRIVSVAPHLTELLFAAGAGDRIVGAVAYSDHPPAAQAIPRIGDSAQLDLERIVSLQPDLIVVWRSGTPAQQLQRLRGLSIPVYASESRRLGEISSTLRRLGTLAGTAAAAERRADAFDRDVAALRERYAGRRPLRAFYQIWHRPLLTINGEHLISDALALCGARNVFADLRSLTPAVSEEAVVAADPDVIVTGSVDPGGGDDNLERWRRLDALRATKLGNLVVVDPDTLHRQSDRIVLGARELCDKLDTVRARLPR
jgi:iron complex transport system substrate-binding protein